MTWEEICTKKEALLKEGKTEEEIGEILAEDIEAFAKECFENPAGLAQMAPELAELMKNNPVLAIFLGAVLSKGGGFRV